MCKELTCLTLIVLVLGLGAGASAELMVHWRLDDGSGTTVIDASGNGRDGTFTGEPQWVAGHNSAGALHFDGVDDFVVHDLGQTETFPTFSVALWVKADTLGQPNFCGAFTSFFPNSDGFQVDVDGGNPGNYRINPNSGNQFAFGPVTTDWIHLALTAEGTTMNLYYNGNWASSNTLVDNDVVFNQFAIGVNRNRNWWLACTIDDLRVYDHVLTEAEIIGVMEGKPWPFAFGPNPEDGAMLEATWANIKWQPGQLAVSHNVYMGESLEDVEAGAESTFLGNQAAPNLIVGFPGFPVPGGLVPGTTYYWRVDEVNDADPNSPWKGDVWNFWIPPKKAYGPEPTDGVSFVGPDSTVSWSTGFGGKLAQMYFGTDSAEVEAGTGGTAKGPVVGTSYDPGPLEKGTTYYWRVDQFDGAETHKGDVWSFATVADIAVTDPDLLGWWTLDEGEGTTAVDWSGHGGHGSFVGEPQWADGYQGMALEFSGSGSYVDCGDDAGAGVTADFTISAWVKLEAGNAGHYGGIAGKLASAGAEYSGFAIVRHSDNDFRLWVADGGDTLVNSQVSSDVLYTDAEWHHVAGVREGQSNMLYVDGVKQSGLSQTDFVPSVDFFHIGRQYSHLDDRYWHGRIDDVRIYNKALTDAQVADAMLGEPKMANNPVPDRDALLDIRDISSLSWSRGSTASSHDVYFGTDRDAVADADKSSPEFQGNQAGASLSLAGLVEFGGGDYYWRIDEIEAGGAVNAGTIWKFTVPDYLIVDNFESYNNIDPPNAGSNRIFDSWIDGFGTTTNGALVGNDLPPYAEQGVVQSGNQSMVYAYDNAGKISEATLTVAKGDWTAEGVTKLSLWFRGGSGNSADRVFIALNGTAVVYHDDAAATQLSGWNEWIIDLGTFGVDLANVNSITIGIGTKNPGAPGPGGTGTMYFDEIGLIR